VSAGGRDRAICQWAVTANAKDHQEVPEQRLELSVLAPPQKHIIEMPITEFTAAGDQLVQVKEGPLEPPMRHVAACPMLLQVCVVTSNVKYAPFRPNFVEPCDQLAMKGYHDTSVTGRYMMRPSFIPWIALLASPIALLVSPVAILASSIVTSKHLRS
jgi:hypothetical protein